MSGGHTTIEISDFFSFGHPKEEFDTLGTYPSSYFESIASFNVGGERSFCSLKRIKSPLRSTLTQENLNNLNVLFMNSDTLSQVNYI